jgi:hypothetical protein
VIHEEDDDVTEGLQGALRDEGIEVVLNAKVKSVSGISGNSVRLLLNRTAWIVLWREPISWSRPGGCRIRKTSDSTLPELS